MPIRPEIGIGLDWSEGYDRWEESHGILLGFTRSPFENPNSYLFLCVAVRRADGEWATQNIMLLPRELTSRGRVKRSHLHRLMGYLYLEQRSALRGLLDSGRPLAITPTWAASPSGPALSVLPPAPHSYPEVAPIPFELLAVEPLVQIESWV